jgi:hypothetical protein
MWPHCTATDPRAAVWIHWSVCLVVTVPNPKVAQRSFDYLICHQPHSYRINGRHHNENRLRRTRGGEGDHRQPGDDDVNLEMDQLGDEVWEPVVPPSADRYSMTMLRPSTHLGSRRRFRIFPTEELPGMLRTAAALIRCG